MSLSDQQPSGDWVCAKCSVPLEVSKITVSYLGSSYPVELLCCPKCGLTLVTEDLALGRMADVEKTLEDK